jgi:hypothetical protein
MGVRRQWAETVPTTHLPTALRPHNKAKSPSGFFFGTVNVIL